MAGLGGGNHHRKVVLDAPERLVLEEWLSRWIGGVGLAFTIGALLWGGLDFDRPLDLFGTPVSPWWPAGAFALTMLWMLLERDRIVFDRAAGSVQRWLRIQRYKAFERPLADIERVEVTSKTSSQYGQESTDHFAHVLFRDGRRLLVNGSADDGYIRALAGRIESFRV